MNTKSQAFSGFFLAVLIALGAWLTVRIGTALFSPQNKRRKIDVMKIRYVIGAAISALIFVMLNAFEGPSGCVDCAVQRGHPFHYWQETGFASDAGLLWGGLLADVLVILAAAMFFAYFIALYDRKRLVSGDGVKS